MFCPLCGTQLPDDAMFCASCGTHLGIYKSQLQLAADQPPSAPQPQPAADQPQFAAQPSAAPKKRGKALPIALAAVAIVIVAVVAVGFFTNWFGLGGDSLYVLKSQTSSASGKITSELAYEYEGGSLSRLTMTAPSNKGSSLVFTSDANGFPVRLVNGENPSDVLDFTNSFDTRGRIVSSAMGTESESFNAEYEYYGDSDNLSSVTYSTTTNLTSSTMLTLQMFRFYPGLVYASTDIVDGDSTTKVKVKYSEAGVPVAYVDKDGKETPISSETRDQLKNQTKTTNLVSSTRERVYDDNGNLVKDTTTANNRVQQETTYEWEKVTSPNRCARTFLRLEF